MDIPQDILNKFIVRPDYLDWINQQTVIFVYLDLTNMLHWQDDLGWKFRIEDVISQLFSFHNIKEIKVYYGKNERDPKNSEAFHNRIRKTGAILRTKPEKFISKSIKEEMFSNLRDLSIWFNKHAGSKAKYLLGDMIEDISTDYILHQNTYTDIRAEMKASLIDTDISELIRPSKLRFVMEYLDLPELVSKLNQKEKRRFVSGELGI